MLIFRVMESGFLWKEETEQKAKMIIRFRDTGCYWFWLPD